MTPSGKEASTQPARRRVLVAEDGSMLRTALIRLLDAADYEIEAVPDGAEALMLLLAEAAEPFDLLIADIVMPGLSGVELVRRMRELMSHPPPVLYMSGDVRPALNDAAGTIGGDLMLAKPFAAEQLLEAIETVLKKGAEPVKQEQPPGSVD